MTRSSQASAVQAASPQAPVTEIPQTDVDKAGTDKAGTDTAGTDKSGVAFAPAFTADSQPWRRRGSAVAVFEPGLPPLTQRHVGAIALFAFEALEGARLVAHLGGWISAEVAEELQLIRALNVERRTLHRDTRRVVASVQRVRLTRVAAGVVEAAIVLATPSRSRAVAARFEGFRKRWQAVVLTVL